ncbi:hypothetical protein Hanom_Chr10g00961851 [Helianthus anomalus]
MDHRLLPSFHSSKPPQPTTGLTEDEEGGRRETTARRSSLCHSPFIVALSLSLYLSVKAGL